MYVNLSANILSKLLIRGKRMAVESGIVETAALAQRQGVAACV